MGNQKLDSKNHIDLLKENKELLPKRITTIYDITSVLGLCSYVDTAITQNIPLDVAMYADLKRVEQHISEPDTLLLINFKTDQNGELKLDNVTLEALSENEVIKHIYNEKSSTNDLSLTQRATGNTVEELFERKSMTYSQVYRTLFSWPNQADQVMSNSPQWLLGLKNISETDRTWAEIDRKCRTLLNKNSGNFEGLVSITIDGKEPYELPQYMDVLRQVVFEDKKENNGERSFGESIDYVTKENTSVIGVNDSDEYPWDYHTSKIYEQYSQINPENGWRQKPISLETSLLISAGSSIIDDLNVSMVYGKGAAIIIDQFIVPFVSGDYKMTELWNWYRNVQKYRNINNTNEYLSRVYPKPEDVSGEEIDSVLGESTNKEQLTKNQDPTDSLYISVQIQGNKNTESYSYITTKNRSSVVHNKAKEIIAEKLEPLYTESSGVISSSIQIHQTTATLFNPQWYVENVCGQDTKKEQRDPNSVEYQIVRALLSGEPVSYMQVIESFNHRQNAEFHDFDFGAKNYSESQAFLKLVSQQYLVLELLKELDLISQDLLLVNYDNLSMSNSENSNTDVEPDEYLKDDYGHITETEAKYPFLLGRIVGAVSYHQVENNDISTPAYMQYPVDYINKATYLKVVPQITQKLLQYVSKEDGGSLSYTLKGDLDQLQTALQAKNPKEFNISDSEIQYYYSLGLVDGLTY